MGKIPEIKRHTIIWIFKVYISTSNIFPGNGSNDVESLKQEIEELKHHLNSNYTVYTRRLEKSKAKRKDLEACLREVTTENERLAREADQAEGIYFLSGDVSSGLFLYFISNVVKKETS